MNGVHRAKERLEIGNSAYRVGKVLIGKIGYIPDTLSVRMRENSRGSVDGAFTC